LGLTTTIWTAATRTLPDRFGLALERGVLMERLRCTASEPHHGILSSLPELSTIRTDMSRMAAPSPWLITGPTGRHPSDQANGLGLARPTAAP